MVLPFEGEQIAEDPVVVGRAGPNLPVHEFPQLDDRIRATRKQSLAVPMLHGAPHDGAGQFKRLGTCGSQASELDWVMSVPFT
ncbi:hypothetical protein [Streptacidiphilus rugosus]|uniref:hypothetical protein n=1 Tax=Streptacidiphilus rugosus TaxID=405783 RepID=UPI0012FB4CE3|nr:hypothetical protein [Streptacidiphilus rugosus]